MPDLSEPELTALRLMMEKPIRIHALSDVQGREEAAAVLDGLARKGLCRRTLEGLSRVYSITELGQEALRTSGIAPRNQH